MSNIDKFLKDNGIKKENLLYLPIAEPFFSRIVSGKKKVEFRSLTKFYLSKLCVFKGDEFVADKPIKYIDFRNGYKDVETSPRAIVELNDWFFMDDESKPITEITSLTQEVKNEIKQEGFVDGDEFIALVLGRVVATDNVAG